MRGSWTAAAMGCAAIVAELGCEESPGGPVLAGFTFHQPEIPLPAYVVAVLDAQGEPVSTWTAHSSSRFDKSVVRGDRSRPRSSRRRPRWP